MATQPAATHVPTLNLDRTESGGEAIPSREWPPHDPVGHLVSLHTILQ